MTQQKAKGLRHAKPKIVIGDTDHKRLTDLATSALDRMPELADELLMELERAKVVKDRSVPANVVRMGSALEYRSNDGQQRRVELVYPGEADIAAGRISILTPVGTALIGLAEGQSIAWTARDGRQHTLSILSVEKLAAAAE